MQPEKAHYARSELSDLTYRVFYRDELILESNQAVKLEEHYDGTDYPAVIYFPADAVAQLDTLRTERSTYCPIKGDASYWSYRDADNGIWCYENPLPNVELIKNRFAFDQGKGFRVTTGSA